MRPRVDLTKLDLLPGETVTLVFRGFGCAPDRAVFLHGPEPLRFRLVHEKELETCVLDARYDARARAA